MKFQSPQALTESVVQLINKIIVVLVLATITQHADAAQDIALPTLKRSYLLILPKHHSSGLSQTGIDDTAQNRVPDKLIVAFHGSGGRNTSFAKSLGLQSVADALSAGIIVPQAKHGNWEEGCACNIAHRLKVDDLGYYDAILADVRRRLWPETQNAPADPVPVFVLGYSQGGMFAHHLACKRTDQIDGVLIVAATLSKPLHARCDPDSSLSMIFINGKKDRVMPYKGTNSGRFATLSATKTHDFWAKQQHCLHRETVTMRDDRGRPTMVVDAASHCDGGHVVELISIEKGRHQWPALDPAYLLKYLISKKTARPKPPQ